MPLVHRDRSFKMQRTLFWPWWALQIKTYLYKLLGFPLNRPDASRTKEQIFSICWTLWFDPNAYCMSRGFSIWSAKVALMPLIHKDDLCNLQDTLLWSWGPSLHVFTDLSNLQGTLLWSQCPLHVYTSFPPTRHSMWPTCPLHTETELFNTQVTPMDTRPEMYFRICPYLFIFMVSLITSPEFTKHFSKF